MNQEELENKLSEMQKSEFLKDKEFFSLNQKTDTFIKEMNDVFGFNDGEPLGEEGLQYVIEYIKYKWMLANAIYEED